MFAPKKVTTEEISRPIGYHQREGKATSPRDSQVAKGVKWIRARVTVAMIVLTLSGESSE